jgi:hypothetical protein
MDLKLEYFYNNITHPVTLGIEESHYRILGSETPDGYYESELRGRRHGVRWQYGNKTIELYEEGLTVIAYPSPDYRYIIAIYDHRSKLFPKPDNCVVYNLDGSIHKKISTPLSFVPNSKNKRGEYFYSVGWGKKGDEVAVELLVSDGGVYQEWIERIEFNPETGEFGELLSRFCL